ncbi:acetyl-CoA carboxylase, biotin carboxyl carrier protein [candidate division WOR-1 bacterium RIFOXYA12_FULL_43_27]|uniref:Biotin carboxyl carrier protein of acetyl-CoA carboxylase n=1 Tax=candidate division WOR-1 bacterium RIFOXYC2_FULL_46_14 TaxID=1802587 RepID=A0A1F4U756_UNCSA|nr:MAG: acetyl-CoA carboxylase, biotin carboxyl carrier protein [candidate division WOR-1 bacterium RIFOXYA12_FULL_43_27]OGC19151.1 MAG: acetyl-CoA carboxylase, biotin carboxyl carrier protein [candidate division WOR-1 bacterium RIFOXYB2_FULL_46_45]OGC30139.1 MAG: acetyl-CoA carboxylase, biotin carboxyl carrier protein [candidate division WOR-1 bacterium RIFOXYA2_FULL_46_56]OGC40741.1 MAG: acetyl-CoA carboxylase, biotin carboxyl carrier protein [candidate division WOR-1 bacterium RIFOXYC2_FULL_4
MVNFDLIKKLIQIVKDENISGLVIEEGGTKYEIRKEFGGTVSASTSAPIPAATSSQPAVAVKKEEPKNEDDGLVAITSPMVGTFYKSPSPDSPPFVNVGDQVASGKVVCIVEAMKLFNEIESEISGKIVKILVENGKPVEYGQKLMLVKKD